MKNKPEIGDIFKYNQNGGLIHFGIISEVNQIYEEDNNENVITIKFYDFNKRITSFLQYTNYVRYFDFF